jgi:heavy metal sensor kinase
MSLASRLAAFFLVVLALVLVGFSLALYLLASGYLHRELDERLEAALTALAAAAELSPEGVEWEPHQRRLHLGQDDGPTQVRWLVLEDNGRVVGRSPNLHDDEALPDAGDGPWRVRETRVASGRTGPPPAPEKPGEVKYPALVLRVAASLGPLQATLRTLALALTGLSVAIWLLAALLGRWLCQSALAPLTQMAESAWEMNADDLTRRLPSPGTNDELQALGDGFNDLLSRLQEAFERQRRFTGDASHQLRTPLAILLGQVEVALLRERPPDEYQRVLRAVAGQGTRLQRIVEMLLFLARADAESAAPELSSVSLVPWLQDHLRNWADHPRAADIRFAPPDEREVHARAHAALLGQAVDILLDNAARYSPPGTPITLALSADKKHVLLSVEDEGCGIAPDDLPQVFEPFYRSPRHRDDKGGVGLGLAIARRVVRAMGGEAEAHSRAGQGSRFVIRLSAVQANAP